MRIVEKCACGGQVEVETADDKLAQRLVEKWRRRHEHAYSKPIPYWPTTPYVTWTSGGTGGRGASTITYSGTTSAVTGSSPSNRTQGED